MPDAGLHRSGTDRLWHHTAALVVEVVSPGDESWAELSFYAARGVEEVVIVDPHKRAVDWLRLEGGSYAPIARSALVETGAEQLAARIDWPHLPGRESAV